MSSSVVRSRAWWKRARSVASSLIHSWISRPNAMRRALEPPKRSLAMKRKCLGCSRAYPRKVTTEFSTSSAVDTGWARMARITWRSSEKLSSTSTSPTSPMSAKWR